MNRWNGNAYSDLNRIKWQLNYLGFRHVRACFCDDYSVSTIRQFNSELGTKFDIWVYGGIYDSVLQEVRNSPGVLESVEGANEADNYAQYFRGLTGLSAAVAEQKQLYADIKGFGPTSTLPVNSFTVTKDTSVPLVGDISAYTDRVSSHIYPQWGGSFGERANGYTQRFLNIMAPLAPGKPHIITEGGWWTRPHPMGVTENVQAKFILNFLLGAFKFGVVRTYLYQLADEYPDATGADFEQHFGLFRNDGSAKPAAIALGNLQYLLVDKPVSTPLANLGYTLDGMPSTGQQLLLQRGDGVYILALWNDAPLWDNDNYRERVVTPVQTMLRLTQQASWVGIFDPLQSRTALRSYTNISGFTVDVPDHPVLVFIKSSTKPALPPTTVLANSSTAQTAARGTKVNITYNWQASPMDRAYKAFVRFVDANGKVWWQDDYTPPVSTLSWSGPVSVTRTITIPTYATSQTYRIATGLYDPTATTISGIPLPYGANVTALGNNRYQVGTLTVP